MYNRSIKSEYNFSNKMTGKGIVDFNTYFTVLEKYINGIRNMSQNMSIVDNFASLFTLIAVNEGSEDITKDSIKRYLTEYLISSMIDVNESVIDLDFDISLHETTETKKVRTLENTQLVVDTRQDKKLKLITPECIFIPVFD